MITKLINKSKKKVKKIDVSEYNVKFVFECPLYM